MALLSKVVNMYQLTMSVGQQKIGDDLDLSIFGDDQNMHIERLLNLGAIVKVELKPHDLDEKNQNMKQRLKQKNL
jgi:adenine deaminase